MELRQLRNFVRICRMRSITAAAERLNIAQPALSRQVQALEEELGVALLRRHGRGVEPTEQGERLLARAERLLSDADGILRDLPGNDGELRGTLTLGLPPVVAEILAEPLIAHFISRYPHVRLRIASGFTGHVKEWLQRGTIDLGITYEMGPVNDRHTRPLVYEQLYLLCPAVPEGISAPITFSEAFAQPLILTTPAHSLRRLLEAAAAQQGITPDVVLEVDIVQVMLSLVRQGHGNTILSRAAFRKMQESNEIIARPIISPELGRNVVLWTPERYGESMLIKRFAETLISQVKQLVDSGVWDARWL